MWRAAARSERFVEKISMPSASKQQRRHQQRVDHGKHFSMCSDSIVRPPTPYNNNVFLTTAQSLLLLARHRRFWPFTTLCHCGSQIAFPPCHAVQSVALACASRAVNQKHDLPPTLGQERARKAGHVVVSLLLLSVNMYTFSSSSS